MNTTVYQTKPTNVHAIQWDGSQREAEDIFVWVARLSVSDEQELDAHLHFNIRKTPSGAIQLETSSMAIVGDINLNLLPGDVLVLFPPKDFKVYEEAAFVAEFNNQFGQPLSATWKGE